MAVTLWLAPTPRVESVMLALPPLRVCGVPKLTPPTWNCTVPPLSNGIGEPLAAVTVAVKVTA